MAVVVDKKDAKQFMEYAHEENLESVIVATVTKSPRLVMHWRGKTIVDISRDFLDTNGAHQEASVKVDVPNFADSELNQNPFVPSDVNDSEGIRNTWLNTPQLTSTSARREVSSRDLTLRSERGLSPCRTAVSIS